MESETTRQFLSGLDDEIIGTMRLHRAPQQVADRLLTAIAVGIYAPGDRLPPERELAGILGVSRQTLRLALEQLLAKDIVSIKRGRQGGTIVRPITKSSRVFQSAFRTLDPLGESFNELLDYRNLIEQQIARTAAERREERDVEIISLALQRYREASSAQESRSADHDLHDSIATATKNPYLRRLSRTLIAASNLGFLQDPFSLSLREQALLSHESLVTAIIDQDAHSAAQVAKEHFLTTSSAPWRELVARIHDPQIEIETLC